MPKLEARHGEEATKTEVLTAELLRCVAPLDEGNLRPVQALVQPPEGVVKVFAAVLVIVRSPEPPEDVDVSWRTGGRRAATHVGSFLEQLRGVGRFTASEASLAAATALLADPAVLQLGPDAPDVIPLLLAWVRAAVRLQKHLQAASRPLALELTGARADMLRDEEALTALAARHAALQARTLALLTSLDQSTRVKNDQMVSVQTIRRQLAEARAFLETLRQEMHLWQQRLRALSLSQESACGRCVLAGGMVTYLAAFSQPFRSALLRDSWLPALHGHGIGIGTARNVPEEVVLASVHPLLHTKTSLAQAVSHDEDALLLDNRAVVAATPRWLLMWDPHGLGVDHVRRMEAEGAGGAGGSGPAFAAIDLAEGATSWANVALALNRARDEGRPILLTRVPQMPTDELCRFVADHHPQAGGTDHGPTELDECHHIQARPMGGFWVYLAAAVLDIDAWLSRLEHAGLCAVWRAHATVPAGRPCRHRLQAALRRRALAPG